MKVYYLHDGKQKLGPYSAEELKNKALAEDTPVWVEHANNWTTIAEITASSSAKAGSPNNRNSRKAKIWTAAPMLIALFGIAYFILNPGNTPAPNPKTITGGIDSSLGKSQEIEVETPFSKETSKAKTDEPVLIAANEKFNPAKYLVKKVKIRKNLVGQTIIEGSITNVSSTGIFKDVVLNVEYLSKTGSSISHERFVVYEVMKPNKKIPFKFKTRSPTGTSNFATEITTAIAIKNP